MDHIKKIAEIIIYYAQCLETAIKIARFKSNLQMKNNWTVQKLTLLVSLLSYWQKHKKTFLC